MNNIPFAHLDWSAVPREEHRGAQGTSFWQTLQFGALRLRIVEYSQGYIADHWCSKGHIVYCLDGKFTSALQNGEKIELGKDMGYVVSDELSVHRSSSENGVRLLIIDGEFLKPVSTASV